MIQQVIAAHMFDKNHGANRALQMLVYREGCDGNSTVVTIPQQELVALLNTREKAEQERRA